MDNSSRPEKMQPGEISERSPLIAWLDNFWYHYKWTVIIGAFFITILIIGIVQIAGRVRYDAVVTVVVPATPDSRQTEDMEALLVRLMPNECNVKGEKQVSLRSWQVYSEEEYRIEKESVEAESQQFNLNAKYNEDELSGFRQYSMTGESVICFVSPYIYASLVSTERLKPLAELYGSDPLPAGIMEDGCGIRLSETDLYRYNPELSGFLPETTILCLLKPTIAGDSSKVENYERFTAFFRALADYRLSE